MTARAIRQALVSAVAVVVLSALPSVSAAQCSYDFSAYADGGPTGDYEPNGDAWIWYAGSGLDYSSCSGAYHEYAIRVTVTRVSNQQVVAWQEIYPGSQIFEYVTVVAQAPEEYDILAEFGVWCSFFMNWVGGANAQHTIQVPPPPHRRALIRYSPIIRIHMG